MKEMTFFDLNTHLNVSIFRFLESSVAENVKFHCFCIIV